MKNTLAVFLMSLAFVSCNSGDSTEPEMEVATAVELAKAKTITVLDTDFSKGRLLNRQTISLWDVQKLHGHLCDGLAVGFLGMQEALNQLYPDGEIDRTNLRAVAKSSPCIGDVGMYLSGGRYQFNTFYVDDSIDGLYVVQRIDDGKAVRVKLRPGIKDPRIDKMGSLAIKGQLPACELDTLQKLEEQFSIFLLNHQHPSELFEVQEISNFTWSPTLRNDFIKTDVLNKHKQRCGAD